MQANCPKCNQKIAIDDARVPDKPFSVKCPKCQTAVKFAGKAAAAPAPPAAPPSAPEPGAGPDEQARAEMMAQIRREMAAGGEPRPDAGRALVSLGDGNKAQAGTAALPLTRFGFHVDTVDDVEGAARLIEQGVYDLVVTTRAAGAGGKETLYQRMNRLGPEARRRVFLVVSGDELKTADGTQAWTVLADMVVNTRDLGAIDGILGKTLDERNRLYQVFNDVRKRFEATAI